MEWKLFIFGIAAVVAVFLAFVAVIVYNTQEDRKQRYELILKCMEQDTAINCAAAFKTGEKK